MYIYPENLAGYRKECMRTKTGVAFLKWFDTAESPESEDIDTYLNAFIAGNNYHHDRMAAVLRQGDGRHEEILTEEKSNAHQAG